MTSQCVASLTNLKHWCMLFTPSYFILEVFLKQIDWQVTGYQTFLGIRIDSQNLHYSTIPVLIYQAEDIHLFHPLHD